MTEPWGYLGYNPRTVNYWCCWCYKCATQRDRGIKRDFMPEFDSQGRQVRGLWLIYEDQIKPLKLACLDRCGNVANMTSSAPDLFDDSEGYLIRTLPKPEELLRG